jgi:Bacterial conjugation TrbI-like protein
LAQGVQIAQETPSLAEGIKLVQSSVADNPVQPDPGMNSGANGARPSFYNSQVISGKSEDLKEDAVKIERLASNRSSEATVTIDNSSRIAKGILVGTSAKGSTVTPILWNAGISSTAKFIIKLDEPIRDNTNQPAIPAGTQLVVTVKPAATNIGFAELEVVSVIIQGREFTPPVGMLTVRDEQNGLLVGEDYFKRNEQIASRDSMTILTGALGRVGQVLTQPTSTVSSVGLGSTTVVNNQSPNILGAVLDGGFSSLPATWSQRNQQALQEIANKPNVYQIPQGRSVRIFVNQTLEF